MTGMGKTVIYARINDGTFSKQIQREEVRRLAGPPSPSGWRSDQGAMTPSRRPQ